MDRTGEFVLGLIGGIFGILAAFVAFLIGEVDAFFSSTGTSDLYFWAWASIISSILAIIGSVVVRNKPLVGGILMLVAAITGFISVSLLYLVPGILILIAGLMGIFRREKALQN